MDVVVRWRRRREIATLSQHFQIVICDLMNRYEHTHPYTYAAHFILSVNSFPYIIKIQIHSSCEIEDFVEPHTEYLQAEAPSQHFFFFNLTADGGKTICVV